MTFLNYDVLICYLLMFVILACKYCLSLDTILDLGHSSPLLTMHHPCSPILSSGLDKEGKID